jgi:hypothetical protein
VGANLKVTYDRVGDILSIDVCDPYVGQETDEIDSGVVARLNPTTGAVENLEILFWSKRIEAGQPLNLPIAAGLHLVEA